MSKKVMTPKSSKGLPKTVVKQMLILATAGFGLVAALAWNEFVKALVETYIVPLLGINSGVLYLFIYAVIVTILAVTVTLWLARLESSVEDIDGYFNGNNDKKNKKSQAKKAN